jgi:hypothetical protein
MNEIVVVKITYLRNPTLKQRKSIHIAQSLSFTGITVFVCDSAVIEVVKSDRKPTKIVATRRRRAHATVLSIWCFL